MENFPNMRKEIVTEVQEAQRVPYRFNPRRNTPRHILIKLTKIKFKEKILKAARGHLQDGGGGRHGDHLPPHKYIKNASTCGTTRTEHLLNAGRRPPTSPKARNSPCTWVGQKKKEKTETKE